MVVLGAGPAGSIASLLLARAGASTLLVDEFNNAGYKVGESLPGIARHLLGTLQLREVLKQDACIPCSGNSSAWGSDQLEHRPGLLDPYGPGVHLDRAAFDGALLAAALCAGVEPLPGRVARSRSATEGWRLSILAQGLGKEIGCRWIVDCTGRRSAIAASLGVKRLVFDNQVAVVGLFGREDDETDRSIVLESSPDGWWYTAPVPNARRVVIYFTDGDLLRRAGVRSIEGFTSLARGTRHIRAFLSGRMLFPTPKIVLASSSRLERAAGEGWIAAGDAAAANDPLASVGIIAAIKGAQAAAKVILSGKAELEAYCKDVGSQHQKIIETRIAYYKLEKRWPQSLFWSRRKHGSRGGMGSDRVTR